MMKMKTKTRMRMRGMRAMRVKSVKNKDELMMREIRKSNGPLLCTSSNAAEREL